MTMPLLATISLALFGIVCFVFGAAYGQRGFRTHDWLLVIAVAILGISMKIAWDAR